MSGHGINGKTVLIAGGAKNLGGLLARDLAAHGAKADERYDAFVTALGRRLAKGPKLQQEISEDITMPTPHNDLSDRHE